MPEQTLLREKALRTLGLVKNLIVRRNVRAIIVAVLLQVAAPVNGVQAQPLVALDAAVTSIVNIPDLLCGENRVAPVVTLKNNGSEVLTSAMLDYGIIGGPSSVRPWTGSLQSGQTVTVILDTLVALTGGNELVVRASAPNNGVDQVPGNDAWFLGFTASEPAGAVNLILTLDDYGSDVTWDLVSGSGMLLYSGGPYTDGTGGEVDSVAFCLTNDCYAFTIRDVFGNGLCCADGEGGYVIRDVFGTVYAESDGQYTDQQQDVFCLEAVSIADRGASPAGVHPNPTNGSFVLSPTSEPILSARVMDTLGRIVMTIPMGGSGPVPVQADLPPGSYLLVIESKAGWQVLRLLVER